MRILLLMAVICFGVVGLSAEETKDNKADAKQTQQTEDNKSTAKKAVKEKKIYTWIDNKGNRIYSDTPRDGAEEMDIKPVTEYSPTSSTSPWANSKPKVVKEAPSYTHFSVVSPAQDATVRNNQGNLQVAFDIRPKLQPGHQLVLLSGGTILQRSASPVVNLMNVDRGTHVFSGQIQNANGDVVATASNSVTVHLHRARVKKNP